LRENAEIESTNSTSVKVYRKKPKHFQTIEPSNYQAALVVWTKSDVGSWTHCAHRQTDHVCPSQCNASERRHFWFLSFYFI